MLPSVTLYFFTKDEYTEYASSLELQIDKNKENNTKQNWVTCVSGHFAEEVAGVAEIRAAGAAGLTCDPKASMYPPMKWGQ